MFCTIDTEQCKDTVQSFVLLLKNVLHCRCSALQAFCQVLHWKKLRIIPATDYHYPHFPPRLSPPVTVSLTVRFFYDFLKCIHIQMFICLHLKMYIFSASRTYICLLFGNIYYPTLTKKHLLTGCKRFSQVAE